MLLNPERSALQAKLEQATGVNVDVCLQCGCCTGGCTGIEFMDFSPRQVIQMIKLGHRETLLNSSAIWFCAACHICEDRCPAGIHITEVMDGLRSMAADDPSLPENEKKQFHRMFLSHIKRFGRLHEGSFTLAYSWCAKMPLPEIKLMWRMFTKGRIDVKLPHRPAASFKKLISSLRERGDTAK
ncbi:MAG: 4Fe-4S dicluster domain-containing protein [Negativicutes bacterium]|nr:4Fe-4S dicluster domain-containing protein [Negativicutes bacterium]